MEAQKGEEGKQRAQRAFQEPLLRLHRGGKEEKPSSSSAEWESRVRKAWRSYSPHIPKGATLIHDGERSHGILIDKLGLKSEVHTTEETKGLKDALNPMYEVNKVHKYLKMFLGRHSGFGTEDLQDWLNLFCFLWNEGPNDSDRVTAFIDRAVRKRAVLRYSDWAESE